MTDSPINSAEETAARENANLQSLLEPDVPPGLVELLGSCRPFTGATLALMSQTKNEWLKRVPASQMDNHYFATLSWLFIQAAPENLVRRVVWDIDAFREAVLDWSNELVDGEPRVTPGQLSGADRIIQTTLGLIDSAAFSVVDKGGGSSKETPPPN